MQKTGYGSKKTNPVIRKTRRHDLQIQRLCKMYCSWHPGGSSSKGSGQVTLFRECKNHKGRIPRFLWEIPQIRDEMKLQIPDETRLDLGCGEDLREGYINCDITKSKGIDVVIDLDEPLPFKDISIDYIRIAGVMAHLKEPLKLKKEIDRVLKVGGKVDFCGCTCHSPHRFNLSGRYRKGDVKVPDTPEHPTVMTR